MPTMEPVKPASGDGEAAEVAGEAVEVAGEAMVDGVVTMEVDGEVVVDGEAMVDGVAVDGADRWPDHALCQTSTCPTPLVTHWTPTRGFRGVNKEH